MLKRESTQLVLAVVAAVVLTILVGLLAAFSPNILEAMRGPVATPSPTPGGLAINRDAPARDFTLTNQNGQPTKLSDLRGKPVLMFFGYTHCPDICPLAMGELKAVKKALGEQGDQVTYVMVSVDGTRDTPEVMKRYVETFDPMFIGLTGDELAVQSIGADYGVLFEKRKPEGTAATYLVDHTSSTYLFDAQGYWRMVFPFQTPPETIAADIRRLLE